jgi:hypothetical protein
MQTPSVIHVAMCHNTRINIQIPSTFSLLTVKSSFLRNYTESVMIRDQISYSSPVLTTVARRRSRLIQSVPKVPSPHQKTSILWYEFF